MVKDCGQGLDTHLADKVFEIFYKASEKGSGYGLGLYKARLALEKMGGSIKISQNEPTGCDVVIQIPKK